MAIVTGGASGIGRATVGALLGPGATVAVLDRDEGGVGEVVDEVAKGSSEPRLFAAAWAQSDPLGSWATDKPNFESWTTRLKREKGNRQTARDSDYSFIVASEPHSLPMGTKKLDGSQVERIEGSQTDRPWV